MGEFKIMGETWQNNVMDEGVKKLMRILGDRDEENINLVKISVGLSDASPEDKTKTELVDEVGEKYDTDDGTVSVNSPYSLELTAEIPDDEITRPATIKEIGIWFGDDTLFARAVNSDGKELGVGEAVTITYDLVIPL